MSILMLLVLCIGCVSHPLGLSHERWNALPPEKQAEYRAQQYQLDESRRQQAATAKAEKERLEQERVSALYANARYGDILTVTMSGGVMTVGKNQYVLEPQAFDIVRGETKTIELRGRDSKRGGSLARIEKIPARFSDDGNTLYLNEDAIRNIRVVFVNTGWNRGVMQPVPTFINSWGSTIQGITARLHLKSLAGEPPRIIIQQQP